MITSAVGVPTPVNVRWFTVTRGDLDSFEQAFKHWEHTTRYTELVTLFDVFTLEELEAQVRLGADLVSLAIYVTKRLHRAPFERQRRVLR